MVDVSRSRLVCSLAGLLLFLAGPIAAQERPPQLSEMEKAVKQRWLGKPEPSVIERMGPAREREAQGDAEYLKWDKTVYFGMGAKASAECHATCRFEAGKLTDFNLVGNDAMECRKLVTPLLTDPEKPK